MVSICPLLWQRDVKTPTNQSIGVVLWYYAIVCYTGLKCQLSGDAPQNSWSSINDVHYCGVFVWLIQILYPLQFGARDQDCILAKRMGWRILPGQCYRNPDIVQSVWKKFRLDELTPVLWSGVRLRGRQAGPDLEGLDRPCPTGRTWISDIAVIIEGDVVWLTRRFPGLMVRVAGNSTYWSFRPLWGQMDGHRGRRLSNCLHTWTWRHWMWPCWCRWKRESDGKT